MTKEEIRAYTKRQGGVFEYIFYYQANPVWLPEDAPAEVKCAWMRLYNQGTKDVTLIERWLKDGQDTTKVPTKAKAKLLWPLQAVPAGYIHG